MRASKKRATLRQPGRSAPTLRRGKAPGTDADDSAPAEEQNDDTQTTEPDAVLDDVAVVSDAPQVAAAVATAAAPEPATESPTPVATKLVASIFGDEPAVDAPVASAAAANASPVLDPKRRVRCDLRESLSIVICALSRTASTSMPKAAPASPAVNALFGAATDPSFDIFGAPAETRAAPIPIQQRATKSIFDD